MKLISFDEKSGFRAQTIRLLFCLTTAILCSPVEAQWQVAPSIGAGVIYDDNAILTTMTDVDASVNGYGFDADANISYTSPISNFSLVPRLRSIRYRDARELDTDDQFLDFDLSRAGQTSEFRLRGNYANESVRTAERSNPDFDIDDPVDIPNDDSGRVAESRKRQRLQLIPEWSHKFNEKTSIRAMVSFFDVNYADNAAESLTDYTDTTFRLFYNRALSERNLAYLSGFLRRYDPARISAENTGYGLTAGLTRSLSEKTRFQVSMGFEQTEESSGENTVNPVGEIAVTRILQTVKILAAYQHTISGGGAGVLSVRDSVSLNLTRALSERVTAGIGVSAYQTRALDSSQANFDERDYVELRSLLVWNLSRTFALNFDYRYTFIDRLDVGESADANQLGVWLKYHPIF